MKRHLATIVLLLLAVGLGVWLWRDRDSVTEGERRLRENNVFSAWRREEITRVEIAHEGETIVLVRDAKTDSSWRMTAPREERVDQAAAERLMTTLEFATRVRKVGNETAPLGLEAPRATGSITMGAIAYRFALGGSSPRPEGSSYLRVDDASPFVVSKELTDALLAPSDLYRDRTVIPYLSLEMARFEVQHAGGGFAVTRRDGRTFDVDGLGVSAGRPSLDRVWSALAEMRAEAFPKEADIDRLTASPRLTIRMTSKEPGRPPGELVIGEACPGHPDDVVVLRRAPTRVAACAPRGALDALLAMTPAALVDRRPFSFRHDEIEELRLEALAGAVPGAPGAPRVIEVARKGTGFHEREPVDRELDLAEADAVSELLVELEKSEASEVTAGKGAPFAAIARAKIRAGEHEEILEVNAEMPRVLRRVRDDARLAVTEAIARRLTPRATTLRSRVVLGESRAVKRVNLRCGTPQELVDEGSGLRLVDPNGYETDGSITQLVDGLVRGKVLAWVADRDDGTFGITPNGCRVVLSFADGNAPRTILFGAEAPEGGGGFYGSVDGQPDVFVAPPALLELVKRIYVSHATLRVDPASLASVKVTVRGKPVTGREPAELEVAAGALYAARAVALGNTDVGPIDVELTFTVADGGAQKRVVCGAELGAFRPCATPSVKAVFQVGAATIAAFLPASARPGDAGRTDAR